MAKGDQKRYEKMA